MIFYNVSQFEYCKAIFMSHCINRDFNLTIENKIKREKR